MPRTRLPLVESVPLHGSSTPLPPLHARWLDAMLGAPTPAEVDTTCDDCVMCKPPPTGTSWDPVARCCTYLPHLPNFLLGGALSDDSVLARPSVEARIAAREGISPIGAGWTRAFAEAWQDRETWFGRERAMRCPHHIAEGGLCGVWKYRNAVCATYFCRTVRDGPGRRFWDAAREVLLTVEHDLSRSCLQELGVAADDWGEWFGRERELYRACFAIVAPLAWSDVLARCRPALAADIEALRALHATLLHPRVPLVLVLAPVRYTKTPHDSTVETVTPEGRDRGILADDAMKRALARFDGRATPIVTRELAREGMALKRPALQRLVDLGILIEPS